MKKLTALIVLFSCITILPAQVTITKNNMPLAGDSFEYAVVQAVGGGSVDVSKTGANTTWDYSALQKSGSSVVKYERSAQTPYAFYFINTMGQKIADNLGFGQFSFTDVYSFYKTSNTDFTAEGIGMKFSGIPLAGNYTDKDEIYHFPLKYNDRDSSSFRIAIQLPGIGSYKQSGKRVNFVDGWGTLTLPGGASYNCLRIKSIVTQVDSVSVTQPLPIAFGFPSTRVEYKWLTTTDKVPVLEVTGTELTGNFTPTTIQYREASSGPGTGIHGAKNNDFNVYPNPAHDKLIIEQPGARVTLFLMNGAEIPVTSLATDTGIEINTTHLLPGVYLLKIDNAATTGWKKIIIAH